MLLAAAAEKGRKLYTRFGLIHCWHKAFVKRSNGADHAEHLLSCLVCQPVQLPQCLLCQVSAVSWYAVLMQGC